MPRRRLAILPISLIVVYLVPTAFPFYWMIKSALERPADVYHPTMWLRHVTLENFTALLTTTSFPSNALNSLEVALMSSTAVVACSLLGGYALARTSLPHKQLLAQLILFSYLFPEVLLGIPFFVMFRQLGLLDTLPGLAVAHVTLSLPFALWLMWQFFQALPREYEEAAALDGSSRLQAFFAVLLPMVLPAVAAVFIFAFAASWNDYVFSVMLIHQDQQFTLPLAMSLFVQQMQMNWAIIQGASILLALPGLLLLLFGHRYLVKGFAAGGLAN